MKDFGFRLLVLWYRLLGSTPTQAEWRARRAMNRPAEAEEAVRARAERNADRRFICVCGQMLVVGEKRCERCGRRQLLPHPVRRLLRALGIVVPDAVPGSILMLVLMVIGYAVQVKVAGGNLLSPVETVFGLLDLGASQALLTLGPQPWRAFTYTLLHGNLMHLLFNGLALVQVGPLVENRFGTGRFLFAWLVGGAAAVTGPPLLGFENLSPVIGASGAVFTLIGMALVRGHLDGDARGRLIRDVMIRWAVYTTIFGLVIGGVAHGAHFGGLAAGALLAFVLPPPDGRPGPRGLGPWLGALGLAGMVASLAAFGVWRAGGALPPRDVPPALSVQWTMARAEAYGPESGLDDAGRDLLRRGRALTGLDAPGADAFLEQLRAYVRDKPVGPALLLLAELEESAEPGLRRVYQSLGQALLQTTLEAGR